MKTYLNISHGALAMVVLTVLFACGSSTEAEPIGSPATEEPQGPEAASDDRWPVAPTDMVEEDPPLSAPAQPELVSPEVESESESAVVRPSPEADVPPEPAVQERSPEMARADAVRLWEQETGIAWADVRQHADDPTPLRYDFLGGTRHRRSPRVAASGRGRLEEARFSRIVRELSNDSEANDVAVFAYYDIVRYPKIIYQSPAIERLPRISRQFYRLNDGALPLVIDQGFQYADWEIIEGSMESTLLLMEALSVIPWYKESQERLLSGSYLQPFIRSSNPWFPHLQSNPPLALQIPGIDGEPRIVYAIDGLWDVVVAKDRGRVNQRIRMARDVSESQVDTLTQVEAPEDHSVEIELEAWTGGDEWKEIVLTHYLLPDLAWHSATSGRGIIRNEFYRISLREASLGLAVQRSQDAVDRIEILNVYEDWFEGSIMAVELEGIVQTAETNAFPVSTTDWQPSHLTLTTNITGINLDEERVTVQGVFTFTPVLLSGQLRIQLAVSFVMPGSNADVVDTFTPDLLLIPVPRAR
ncbi:MAG: hypothetical protein EA401_05260 [Planctomycetota bacterium]|nr:MAG: hypothetical protein EA401_05260 [Planctomycetota bacterium]